MGLNSFAIFTGYGVGSVLFQLLLGSGFAFALGVFGCVQLTLAVLALRAFRTERAASH